VAQVLIDQLHIAEAQGPGVIDERILPALGLQVLATCAAVDCLTYTIALRVR
jgi:hypothetical protein